MGKRQILMLLAPLILCITSCVTDKEEPEWFLMAGDMLPQFEVTTIDGNRVSSTDSYYTELVIVFFNTTCPDCQRELPILQKQYEDNLMLPDEDRSQYICIAREEGAKDIEKYWNENHLTIPVSAQEDRKIYSKFASVGIPRIFYAKNGVIIKSE